MNVPNRTRTPQLDSREHPIVDGERSIPIEALRDDHGGIETASLADMVPDALDHERFMQEPVTIFIAGSAVEGDLSHVEASVNGQRVLIERDRPTRVKRMFVEVLLRAKTSHYTQKVINQDAANISTPLVETVGLTYPVTIQEDSPRGRTWAKAIMTQRG